tara:strand:- start:3322 stop:3759 length:438 start_codon:yes stop_codon:yes gene_type:complete
MEARRQARKFAVQVTFQYFFNNEDTKDILKNFFSLSFIKSLGKPPKYDEKFLLNIVEGVDSKRFDIDKIIQANLSKEWEIKRIDLTMKSIISLAVFELCYLKKIPYKVIINEYVSISKTYFNDKDTGFINGILDNIARKVREIKK